MKSDFPLTIVIPVYNDRQGLIASLASIEGIQALSNCKFKIIVIDDSSTEDTYSDIPSLFEQFCDITLLKTPHNQGPGPARQMGVNICETEYLMFLDAGDIIGYPMNFLQYLNIVKEYPDVVIFSSAHDEATEIHECLYVEPQHNRLHGKIYKTSFIKEHNIVFPEGILSQNEDIGYNTAIKLICDNLFNNDNISRILEYEKSTIIQTFNPNSITKKDNFSYNIRQNQGAGPQMVHSFKTARDNGVDISLIEKRGYEIFVYQYMCHYEALYNNKYIEESLEGCLAFYSFFFKELIAEINFPLFMAIYNGFMLEVYSNPQRYALAQNIITFTVNDFLAMLEEEYQKKNQEN